MKFFMGKHLFNLNTIQRRFKIFKIWSQTYHNNMEKISLQLFLLRIYCRDYYEKNQANVFQQNKLYSICGFKRDN
jgi:hypothetical protein